MADKRSSSATANQGSQAAAPAQGDASPEPTRARDVDLDAMLEQELGEDDEVQDPPAAEWDDESGQDDRVREPEEDADEADDDGVDADEDSEEEPEAEEADEEADEDEDADDADEDSDDDDEDAEAPKGLEKLAKGFPWAAKRIERQSKQIQELKRKQAEKVTALAPTPIHPLADVEDLDGYQDRLNRAKEVRRWCRENPDGGEVRVNGRLTEVTQEQVERKLDEVDALLEQAPDWKVRLLERERSKPWEQAEQVLPQVFDEDSKAHKMVTELVTQCPELKLRFPDWEVKAAAMVRGLIQAEEEKTGKVRYARVEVGKNRAGDSKTTTKGKEARKPAKGPGRSRPPARAAQGGKADLDGAVSRFEKTREPEDLKSVLAAELGETW
jgi:hypothetical protein